MGRQDGVKVVCEVEANPYDITYNWKFNTSKAELLDIPQSHIAVDRTKSTAVYTPMTEHVIKFVLFKFNIPFECD